MSKGVGGGLSSLLGGYSSEEEEGQAGELEVGEDTAGVVKILGVYAEQQQNEEKDDKQVPGESGAGGGAVVTAGAVVLELEQGELGADGAAPLVLPEVNPNPEPAEGDSSPESCINGGYGGATAGRGRKRFRAEYLDLLPEEYREAPGPVDPELQENITKYIEIQNTSGRLLSDSFRRARDWRNPDFLQRMVEHFNIDQYGSSFSPEVWDPAHLPSDDFSDALLRQSNAVQDRRASERAAKQQVAFKKGEVRQAPALPPGIAPAKGPLTSTSKSIAHAQALARERAQALAGAALKKTKWDNVSKP